MNNSNKQNSGSEMLIKALGIKKMISDKMNNEANDNREEVIIYDLTAGLGRDTLVILSSYFDYIDGSNGNSNEYIPRLKLHMVDQDQIVALLLKDAMRRLNQLASLNQIDNDERSNIARRIVQCLSMEEGDGVTVLNRLIISDKNKESAAASSSDSSSTSYTPYPPDVCYLDPMFTTTKEEIKCC